MHRLDLAKGRNKLKGDVLMVRTGRLSEEKRVETTGLRPPIQMQARILATQANHESVKHLAPIRI